MLRLSDGEDQVQPEMSQIPGQGEMNTKPANILDILLNWVANKQRIGILRQSQSLLKLEEDRSRAVRGRRGSCPAVLGR